MPPFFWYSQFMSVCKPICIVAIKWEFKIIEHSVLVNMYQMNVSSTVQMAHLHFSPNDFACIFLPQCKNLSKHNNLYKNECCLECLNIHEFKIYWFIITSHYEKTVLNNAVVIRISTVLINWRLTFLD